MKLFGIWLYGMLIYSIIKKIKVMVMRRIQYVSPKKISNVDK